MPPLRRQLRNVFSARIEAQQDEWRGAPVFGELSLISSLLVLARYVNWAAKSEQSDSNGH